MNVPVKNKSESLEKLRSELQKFDENSAVDIYNSFAFSNADGNKDEIEKRLNEVGKLLGLDIQRADLFDLLQQEMIRREFATSVDELTNKYIDRNDNLVEIPPPPTDEEMIKVLQEGLGEFPDEEIIMLYNLHVEVTLTKEEIAKNKQFQLQRTALNQEITKRELVSDTENLGKLKINPETLDFESLYANETLN